MTIATSTTVPSARYKNLVVTQTASEVLVYDQDSHHIHHLNESSAAIWRLCDGQRSLSAIAVEAGMSNEMVQVALGKLADAGLLEDSLASHLRASGQSRRSFVKKAAIAGGIAIPAVVSVSAPSAAQGISYPGDCNKTCTSQSQCNNCCSQCNGLTGGSAGCTGSAPAGVCVHPTVCLSVEGLGVSCNPR